MTVRASSAILTAAFLICGLGCTSLQMQGKGWKVGQNDKQNLATSPNLNTTVSASSAPITNSNQSNISGKANLSNVEAARANLEVASQCEKSNMDRDAIPHYEKARQLDPNVSDLCSRRLAILYDKVDAQAEAMKEFQQLLAKHPKDSQLLADVAYSYYNRGQWSEVEAYARRAIAADKSNQRAWNLLGLALGWQDRPADAIAAFEKAVSRAEARANLAFVMAVRGRKEDSMGLYRQALQLEPTLQHARQALAKLEQGGDGRIPVSANPIRQAALTQPAASSN